MKYKYNLSKDSNWSVNQKKKKHAQKCIVRLTKSLKDLFVGTQICQRNSYDRHGEFLFLTGRIIKIFILAIHKSLTHYSSKCIQFKVDIGWMILKNITSKKYNKMYYRYSLEISHKWQF